MKAQLKYSEELQATGALLKLWLGEEVSQHELESVASAREATEDDLRVLLARGGEGVVRRVLRRPDVSPELVRELIDPASRGWSIERLLRVLANPVTRKRHAEDIRRNESYFARWVLGRPDHEVERLVRIGKSAVRREYYKEFFSHVKWYGSERCWVVDVKVRRYPDLPESLLEQAFGRCQERFWSEFGGRGDWALGFTAWQRFEDYAHVDQYGRGGGWAGFTRLPDSSDVVVDEDVMECDLCMDLFADQNGIDRWDEEAMKAAQARLSGADIEQIEEHHLDCLPAFWLEQLDLCVQKAVAMSEVVSSAVELMRLEAADIIREEWLPEMSVADLARALEAVLKAGEEGLVKDLNRLGIRVGSPRGVAHALKSLDVDGGNVELVASVMHALEPYLAR
jgi:hypothetical protein